MAKKKEPAFEELLENLQDVMEQVEEGELGLQDTITRFEEGMKLIKKCREVLDDAELRINKLKEDSEETEPFDPRD